MSTLINELFYIHNKGALIRIDTHHPIINTTMWWLKGVYVSMFLKKLHHAD